MELRFDGRIDLNKIADYELLVASSDLFLSGNGGMDKAVQKKMSETGRLELKNRPKLEYGDAQPLRCLFYCVKASFNSACYSGTAKTIGDCPLLKKNS